MYNTEKYLRECVDSILAQTFTDYELLLIDDGSTDSSGAICDEYAQKDSRVRVFHKENGGVSSARNLGLDNANGEWITFVDSDDMVYEDSLGILYESSADDTIDFIVAGFDYYNNDKKNISYTTANDKFGKKKYFKNAGITNLYENELGYWCWFMCSKLFRRSIIQQYNIRFNTTIKYSEDRLFISLYSCKILNNICFFTTPVYKYRIHRESVMGKSNEKFNEDFITGVEAAVLMYKNILKESSTRYNKFLALCDIIYSYRTMKKIIRNYIVSDNFKHRLDEIFFNVISIKKYYFILFCVRIFALIPNLKKVLKKYDR